MCSLVIGFSIIFSQGRNQIDWPGNVKSNWRKKLIDSGGDNWEKTTLKDGKS